MVKNNVQNQAEKGRTQSLQIQLTNGTVDVGILHYCIPALIDSGATVSVISKRFFDSISENVSKVVHCNYKIFTADGSVQTAHKATQLTFSIKNIEFQHSFLILPKLKRSIILGVDFLRLTSASIEFTNLNTTTLTIRSPFNTSLPPMSEYTLYAVLNNPEPQCHTMGITENMLRKTPVPYLVKRALVRPNKKNNLILITIFNASEVPYHLTKGAILGLYVCRTEDDFLSEISTPTSKHVGGNFDIDQNLSPIKKAEISNLLSENEDVFVGQNKHLGLTSTYEHRIDLKRNYTPINIMPYRASPERAAIMNKMLDEQEQLGIIEKCCGTTEWASPAFLVEKPKDENNHRQFRMVIDYRHLNSQIKDQARTFPRADDTLQAIGQLRGKYFSKLEAHSVFFPNTPES